MDREYIFLLLMLAILNTIQHADALAPGWKISLGRVNTASSVKTDYTKLTEQDFQQTINDYLAYLVKEGYIYES